MKHIVGEGYPQPILSAVLIQRFVKREIAFAPPSLLPAFHGHDSASPSPSHPRISQNGSALDLAIALAILSAQSHLPALTSSAQTLAVVGEVGLDGRVLPVHGVLPMAAAACEAGIRTLVVPRENSAEASLVTGLQTFRRTTSTTLLDSLHKGISSYPRATAECWRAADGMSHAAEVQTVSV
ncbi:MAG: magnesium chelatase domain-containing protein [Lawsonella clevelandensis]